MRSVTRQMRNFCPVAGGQSVGLVLTIGVPEVPMPPVIGVFGVIEQGILCVPVHDVSHAV
jgi:hypothetical protein